MQFFRSDISCRQIWVTQIKTASPTPPKVTAPVYYWLQDMPLLDWTGILNILAQRCIKEDINCSKGADTLLCHPIYRGNTSRYFKNISIFQSLHLSLTTSLHVKLNPHVFYTGFNKLHGLN